MNRPPAIRASLLPGEIIADNFAGGGGATEGIEDALGQPVDIACNHDPVALAMYKANHPHAKLFCENIYKVVPREATGGRPVGMAWFSPDCTHHSRARGGKPCDTGRRGLAWVILRWAHDVQPRIICVENVEEFEEWGPLLPDGKPDRTKAGTTFRLWVNQLRGLGYPHIEWRSLVAADYGAPTTRRRFFLVARRDRPVVWPEPTHGAGRPLPWRTAAEIILRREELLGVVSFSDPVARRRADGTSVFAGHIGTIYQAHNGRYLGRSTARTLHILPDGTVFSARSAQKIRARERGWRYSASVLERLGADVLGPQEDAGAWLRLWLPRLTRTLRHPGNHRYAWALSRRIRRHLPESQTYPKQLDRLAA